MDMLEYQITAQKEMLSVYFPHITTRFDVPMFNLPYGDKPAKIRNFLQKCKEKLPTYPVTLLSCKYYEIERKGNIIIISPLKFNYVFRFDENMYVAPGNNTISQCSRQNFKNHTCRAETKTFFNFYFEHLDKYIFNLYKKFQDTKDVNECLMFDN